MVGDLDEPAQVHLVAHVGVTRGVGLFPEGFETPRVGLAEPGQDLVVGQGRGPSGRRGHRGTGGQRGVRRGRGHERPPVAGARGPGGTRHAERLDGRRPARRPHDVERRGEGLQRPLEDAQTVRDGQPVVGDGNPGLLAAQDAGEHGSAVGGAGAAVDHGAVGRQVLGKVVALDRVHLELAAHILVEPPRDLHPADVVGDGVMAARLGDEDAVAGPQVLQGEGALHLRGEVAFEAGEQDGEAGHGDVQRGVGRHFEEGLRVGDHQLGRRVETRQGGAQLPLLDHEGHGVGVQQVADGLHLRQDEAAARGLLVHGDHQHGQAIGPHQVGEDRRVLDEVLGRALQERLPQVEDAVAVQRRHGHRLDLGLREHRGGSRRHRRPAVNGVDLVEHGHRGDASPGQLRQDPLLELAPLPRLGDDDAQVSTVEHLRRPPGPEFTERAHVVQTGRVDEQHRAEGQQLHGLLHRVGGGAGGL